MALDCPEVDREVHGAKGYRRGREGAPCRNVPKEWDVDDEIPVRSDHKTVATKEAEDRGGGSTGPHSKGREVKRKGSANSKKEIEGTRRPKELNEYRKSDL